LSAVVLDVELLEVSTLPVAGCFVLATESEPLSALLSLERFARWPDVLFGLAGALSVALSAGDVVAGAAVRASFWAKLGAAEAVAGAAAAAV
jgi:hypothetical protein